MNFSKHPTKKQATVTFSQMKKFLKNLDTSLKHYIISTDVLTTE